MFTAFTCTARSAVRSRAIQAPMMRSYATQGPRVATAAAQSSRRSMVTMAALAGVAAVGITGYSTYPSFMEAAAGAPQTPKQAVGQALPLKDDKSKGTVESSPKALNPKEFVAFKLKEIIPINHNTKLFRFELPDPNAVSGLSIASCVITRCPKPDGSKGYVIRPYTPTSDEEAQGFMDFIIKRYDNGAMSVHIHNMKVGDTLNIKGPIPKWTWKRGDREHVGMIAGGTGITPMLQLIRKIFKDPEDQTTKVTLIFANQTEQDILLKDELDRLAKENPDRFKVVYTLDNTPSNWTCEKGYVTEAMVGKYLPKKDEPKSIIYVCGPDAMLASIAGPKAKDKSQGELGGVLAKMGYAADNVYKF
ncbi:hypothetical protein BZG36_02302 [Bifiguratus adelaidae]|uniref:NADH-cytochrome b5 reductase n=1 Tax=Bifiguratus adelaidae TaxID=1938954 RepID=A0A261Y3T0_9FUNG|nr:hypothetical protein BZG36_02302 [Bifiguratus adelaidae]